ELILGVAHHLSDIDVSRCAHQTDAAAATAHCVEITFFTEIVDDLHQVRLRDIKSLRDIIDRRELTVVEPDLNEDAQREIDMLRRACGYALANRGHDTTLQAYLGHKNIQHTVRYTELSPTRFKDFWRK